MPVLVATSTQVPNTVATDHRPQDAEVWATCWRMVANAVPQGVTATLYATNSDIAYAATRFPTATQIRVDYNPNLVSSRKSHRVGQLAATFVHELFVHGRHVGDDDRMDQPDRDHREMFTKPTRSDYLAAVHQVFAALDALERKHFVNAWADDIRARISQDEGLFNEQTETLEETIGKGEKRVAFAWATKQRQLMLAALADPRKLR